MSHDRADVSCSIPGWQPHPGPGQTNNLQSQQWILLLLHPSTQTALAPKIVSQLICGATFDQWTSELSLLNVCELETSGRCLSCVCAGQVRDFPTVGHNSTEKYLHIINGFSHRKKAVIYLWGKQKKILSVADSSEQSNSIKLPGCKGEDFVEEKWIKVLLFGCHCKCSQGMREEAPGRRLRP